MFLKNRNGWNLLWIVLAALCLAGGMTIGGRGIDTLYRELFPAETGGDVSETVFPIEESMWESEVDEIETEAWESTEEDDTAAMDEAGADDFHERPADDTEFRQILAAILLIAGGLLAGAAVFIRVPTKPLIGVESGLLLLYIAAVSGTELYAAWVFFLLQFVRPVLILSVLRSLWGWLHNRLAVDWTDAHRLGMLWQRASGRWSRYLLVQLLMVLLNLGIIALLGGQEAWRDLVGVNIDGYLQIGAVWIDVWQAAIFGLIGLFVLNAVLAVRNCLSLGRHTDHLLRQIDTACEGGNVETEKGIYEENEKQLAQLSIRQTEAVQKALTSERFKVELISNVSHDLRTPLTSILGYGELLEKETLSAEGTEQLRLLNTKAGYMKELVDSLFELTKVSSGVIPVNWQQIDLIRLLEQTIGLFDDQLTAAGLQVKRHYETEELPLVTDGARLHQVFANLFGNAIKYAMGGTRIHLDVMNSGNGCIVRMTNISSYEMDFAPEEILQRFARGDKVRTTKGSGLGLAIAQTYTESVGGQFRVEIDGDCFRAVVELPRKEL